MRSATRLGQRQRRARSSAPCLQTQNISRSAGAGSPLHAASEHAPLAWECEPYFSRMEMRGDHA